MKRPTTLLRRILLDEGLQTSVAVERDAREIERRFEHEGMSFLTISLPSLCDTLDQGLERGRITPTDFVGFKPIRRGGKLPALLSGFFMRVFESDGSLKEDPCVAAIRAIRQVTRLFKKVELPCSAARIKRAYEGYVSNDEEAQWDQESFGLCPDLRGYLWSDLEDFAGELFCSPGVFGNGATAERLTPYGRYAVREWPTRSESSFPSSYHCVHREDDVDTLEGIHFLPEDAERPVRVVQVPKTLKAPRTISVEPSYMMLMQQSVAKPLMDYLEFGHPKTRSIRFSDQTHNREMARLGSIDGSYATIDLKDASDMVSNDLVKHIFSVCPTFLNLIQDCRTSRAQLPDKRVISLRKFASMGSALCFPIEAMVFFTLVLQSLVHQSGKRPSSKLLKEITAKISVYGDDIIIPAETAPGVMEYLEANGLKVNRSKSFYAGSFKESCGGDFYRGQDVTPVYVRHWDDTGKARDSRVMSSYISLSNQLYVKGLWNASQHVRESVQQRWRTPIPFTRKPVGVLSFASCLNDTGLRWDPTRCGWRVKGPSIEVGKQADALHDIRAAMLLCFGPQALTVRRRQILRGIVDGRREHLYMARAGYQRSFDPSEWLSRDIHLGAYDHDHAERPHLAYLRGRSDRVDQLTSPDSYSSNVKNRWTPVHDTGITW